MSDQTFKDLFHVVPAASKAYIYIATAWTCEDENGKVEREWGDGVFDVLAYATTRAGWGAYLVNAGKEGPMWITPQCNDNLFIRVFVQDERPEARGGFWEKRDKVINGNYDKEVSPLDPDYSDEINFIFAE
jgi:hypothetical protein|tara:strand:+ start:71 stop:463 length:393 start_codon:yes stop_codon:yes gene_type:complete